MQNGFDVMFAFSSPNDSPIDRKFLAANRWRRLLVMLALFIGASKARAETPPNVLLILADDLGYSDLGCYGGEIQTPNLDSIADSGLRFTQFYNTGRCWPTRGALLSGYYAQQIRRDFLPGVTSGGQGTRPEWAQLLPEMLASAGYRSYHTGKWHIDGKPTESGFDVSSLNQVGRYFRPLPGKDGRRGRPLEFEDDFYLTSAMADDAIANLKQHQQRHSNKPFFQYLAFTAPHFPLHALPEDIAIYDQTYQVGWDVIRRRRFEKMRSIGVIDSKAASHLSAVEPQLGPPYHFPDAFEILGEDEVNRPMPWAKLTKTQQLFQAKKMAIHAAMIHRMDIEIGRVFDQIRSMNAWENTLVLFLSDNGASAEIMVRGDGHDPQANPGSGQTYLCLGPGWSTTCNTPFRRHKTWTHEGGIATPFLVSWPQGVGSPGSIRRSVQHVIDVVPTVVELAGASQSDQSPQPPGVSFAKQLPEPVDTEPRTLWWYHDAHRAIRQGDWKAVSPKDEPWELYHLASDRIENVDLAIPEGQKLRELTSQWEKMKQAMTELASKDLTPEQLKRSAGAQHTSEKMLQAQRAAQPKRSQQLLGGLAFRVADRHAFLIAPDGTDAGQVDKPWIFYAPALSRYPDQNESWMFKRFLEAGVAIAGIDVGEGYGSPHSQSKFDALYDEMVRRGYSSKPALLGRSRGGLWVSRFAIERPERVAAIGGIYPVFDYTTYPGVERAASVYGVSASQLEQNQESLNPIKRAAEIAESMIPVYLVHGTEDQVVPIEENSNALETAYQKVRQGELITVKRIHDQGHNLYQGFFRDEGLTNFLINAAKGQANAAAGQSSIPVR
ncbi:sulfatase-like hydrolase/transferase [Roseiconus lacunae]|uniref:sulfatase-like hydrolase/transferase n=1 Tax=Roseiconus lacunae TaxID=2605694 RepID=UPI001E2E5007|nr:sulfatase-like hydrolase/transferase [Roseiconus lacunae]